MLHWSPCGYRFFWRFSSVFLWVACVMLQCTPWTLCDLFCYSSLSPFSPFSPSVSWKRMQTYQHTKCTLTVDFWHCEVQSQSQRHEVHRVAALMRKPNSTQNTQSTRSTRSISFWDLFVKRKTGEQTSRQAVPDLFTVFYVMSPRGVNGWNKTYRKFKLDAKTAKGQSWTVRMCGAKVWHRCPRLGWWKRPRSQTMSAFRCFKKILRYLEMSNLWSLWNPSVESLNLRGRCQLHTLQIRWQRSKSTDQRHANTLEHLQGAKIWDIFGCYEDLGLDGISFITDFDVLFIYIKHIWDL